MPDTGRIIKPPQLSDVPDDIEPRLRQLLEGIIQTLDLREGRNAPRTNSRFTTIQDLVDAGVIDDGDIE